MKKLLAIALLGLSSLGWGVQQTNRLGLYLPAVGSPNWGQYQNTNWQILDSTVNTGSGGGTGGGSTNGTILAAPQYSAPFYALSGSTTTLTGLTPGTSGQVFTTAGSSASPFWSTVVTSTSLAPGSSNYIQNSPLFVPGEAINMSTATISSMTVTQSMLTNSLQSIDPVNSFNLAVPTSGTNAQGSLFWYNGSEGINALNGPGFVVSLTRGPNLTFYSPYASQTNGRQVFVMKQINGVPFAIVPSSDAATTGVLAFAGTSVGTSQYVGLRAPAGTSLSGTTWNLPSADASGCWQSDGSGNLSISACPGGGGGGSTGGSIIASTQNNFGYYSAVATNTINGTSFITLGTSQIIVTTMTVSSITATALSAGGLTLTATGYPYFIPPDGNKYGLVGSSASVTVGHYATFSSTNGAIVDGGTGSGGGGTPGGVSTQMQFNNAGSFGGTNLETVDASSVSFNGISSMTYIGFSTMVFQSGTALDVSSGTFYVSTETYNNGSIVEALASGLQIVSSMTITGQVTVTTTAFNGQNFSTLGPAPNGTFQYCPDCTVTTPATCVGVISAACVCAGSGSGAFAKRLNSTWYCN